MKCLSGSDYQTVFSVGAVRNLLSIAMGKAMLATMSEEEVRSIIQPEMFLVCNLATIYDMAKSRPSPPPARRSIIKNAPVRAMWKPQQG